MIFANHSPDHCVLFFTFLKYSFRLDVPSITNMGEAGFLNQNILDMNGAVPCTNYTKSLIKQITGIIEPKSTKRGLPYS